MANYIFILLAFAVSLCEGGDLIEPRTPGPLGIVSPAPHRCNFEFCYLCLYEYCIAKGESSKFIKLEVSGCTNQPCVLPTWPTYVGFAPSIRSPHYSKTMKYTLRFHPTGGSTVTLANFVAIYYNFRPGHDERVEFWLTIAPSLKGKSGVLELVMLDHDRRHINRCFNVTLSA